MKNILLKYRRLAGLVIFAIIFIMSASTGEKKQIINFPTTDLAAENMIPKPLKIISTNAAFGLDQYTAIYTSQTESGFNEVAEFLSDKIKGKTGLNLPVNKSDAGAIDRVIYINKTDSTELAVYFINR